MRRISYREFSSYLSDLRDSGGKAVYSEKEIRHLFSAVERMSKETRRWFVDWFDGNGYPKESVEGVTVEYLVNECGKKPINAFIIIDWLKQAPEEAKYFMLNAPEGDVVIGEKGIKEMEEFLKSKNHVSVPEPDDTDKDIAVD